MERVIELCAQCVPCIRESKCYGHISRFSEVTELYYPYRVRVILNIFILKQKNPEIFLILAFLVILVIIKVTFPEVYTKLTSTA